MRKMLLHTAMAQLFLVVPVASKKPRQIVGSTILLDHRRHPAS